MKGKLEYVILALVIAGLSAYLLLHKEGRVHYTLPALEKIADKEITRMVIRGDGREIAVERKAGTWTVGPEKYRADRERVESLVRAVAEVKLTDLVSESKSYKPYGLDPDQAVEVTVYRGDKAARTLWIGKTASTFRHTFVRVGDDPRVYHAEGNLKDRFHTSVDQLRDKVVLRVAGEVTSLALNKGSAGVEIHRAPAESKEQASGEAEAEPAEAAEENQGGGKAPARWVTAQGRPARTAAVEDLLRDLRELRCDSFLGRDAKDELADPVATIRVQAAETYTLTIYPKREDGKYPAVSSQEEYPFLLPEWRAKRFLKEPEQLLEEGEPAASDAAPARSS